MAFKKTGFIPGLLMRLSQFYQRQKDKESSLCYLACATCCSSFWSCVILPPLERYS